MPPTANMNRATFKLGTTSSFRLTSLLSERSGTVNRLTERQRESVDEWMKTSNASRVAIKTGYSGLSTAMIHTHIFDQEVESPLKSFRQAAAVAV